MANTTATELDLVGLAFRMEALDVQAFAKTVKYIEFRKDGQIIAASALGLLQYFHSEETFDKNDIADQIQTIDPDQASAFIKLNFELI